MKTFLTLILYVCTLLSQDDLSSAHYPELYSQLGTPLFEQTEKFLTLSRLPLFHPYRTILEDYIHQSAVTLEHGLNIDTDHRSQHQKTKAYLKELRGLQALHDKIENVYKKELYKSIREDDPDTYYALITVALPFILTDMRLKEEVVRYYQKTRLSYSSSHQDYDFFYLKTLSADLRLDQSSYSYMPAVFHSLQNNQEVSQQDALSSFIPDPHSKRPVRIISIKTKDGFDLYLENHAYFDVTIELKATALNNLANSESLPFVGSFPAQSRSKIMHFSIQDLQKQSLFKTSFNATIGRINPQYDRDYPYALPYARGESYELTQGFNGQYTHKKHTAYALDFKMDEGTRVHAMREGVVVALEEKQTEHGNSPAFAEKSNHIIIQHDDGTMAMYGHLKPNGVKVRLGQRVYKHAFIGLSGNTGYSSGPHLHVHISAVKDLKTGPVSVPFRFLTQSGLIDSPKEQSYYTAK